MSRSTLSSLQLRVISAVILAPIAIAALYYGGLFFTLFMAISATAMSYEWCRASFKKEMPSYFSLIAIWVLVAIYLTSIDHFSGALVSLLICAAGVLILTRFRKTEKEWKGAFLGPLYIGIPVICMIDLRAFPNEGFGLTAALFFVVWATDIGAYFSGKTIGGPKIAVSISPNKTWAGLIGGMICAGLVAYLCSIYLFELKTDGWLVILAGLLSAVLAQVGDFAESGWKRFFGIKDASNMIPGHGGVLDRLDGVLFVAPALYAMSLLVGM